MRRTMMLGFGLFAVAALGAGCSRKAPSAAASAPVLANVAANVSTSARDEAPHGSRKKKNLDVPVIVDGAYVSTLRFGELPPGVTAHARTAGGTGAVRFYRLADYLRAIGVPVERVRSIHARGTMARISSVEGDELRREPERFVVDFLEGVTGAAKVAWDTTGLANKFRIDDIHELLVYVDKAAPALDAQRSCYLPAGEIKCSEAVPYAQGEVGKGTRIYLDGKLVGQVKRRRLTDDLVVGKDASGATEFAMEKLLAQVGIDAKRVRAVELVSGDDLVARADGSAFAAAAAKRELTFVLPQHQHGRVRLQVPAAWQSKEAARADRATEVTAVLVFEKKTPDSRPLTVIPDAPPSEEQTPAEDG